MRGGNVQSARRSGELFMVKLTLVHASALVLCSVVAVAVAVEPSEKDARAMCEDGARFIQTYGKEKMIALINARDPRFNRGTLYLAMRDMNGLTVAHPTLALIGKNLLEVPDADGKPFRQEMLAIAKGGGSGWVQYKFRNPVSGKVEAKTTYVLRVGEVALEAGVYKR